MGKVRHDTRFSVPWPILGLGIVVAASQTAAAQEPLDLARAVEIALQHNPSLQAAVERRREVEGGVTEARAEALPDARLVTSYNAARSPTLLNSPDFEEFVEQFPDDAFAPEVQELTTVRVEVNQALFTWGRISAALALARLVEEANEAGIETARLDTALEAADGFYALLSAMEAERVVELQQRVRDEALTVVQARYDLGEATRLELLRATAAREEVAPALAQAEGAVHIGRIRLRTALGLAPDEPLTLSRDRGVLPDLPSRERLLAIALERRPELSELTLQSDALGERKAVVLADGRPQLSFRGAYGRQARQVENLTDTLYDDWYASVELSWSFFDGWRRRGQATQLDSQRAQLSWQLQSLQDQVRLEVTETLTAYETAQSRHRAAEVSAEAATEAARVAEETYREGVAIQADWLDAQQRAAAAQLLEVEAFYAARRAAARLCRAIGRLPTELPKPPARGSDEPPTGGAP